MKGMTNNQIIMNEAATAGPRHPARHRHRAPHPGADRRNGCKRQSPPDENGDEQPATIADVEIILAAAELHTFDHWKKEGKSVKKGETAFD